MTNQNVPVVVPQGSTAVVGGSRYSPAEIEVIKATHFKKMEDAQIQYAMAKAERMGLDFFRGDVVAWPGKDNKVEVFTTIAGLRRLAEETQKYFPGRAPTFQYDGAGNIVSCTAYVKRWDDKMNSWQEIEGQAWWNESAKSDGAWTTHHHSMLAKCAEAFALRRAFASLAGLYITEEQHTVADTDHLKSLDRDASRDAKLKALESRQKKDAAPPPPPEQQAPTGGGGAAGPVTIETTAEKVEAPGERVMSDPVADAEGERLKLLADCKAIIEKFSMPKKVVLYKKLGMALNADITPCSYETLEKVFAVAVEVRG